MPVATEIGKAGLQGWRAKVGESLAQPVASRTPFSADDVRAAVGALFFVLSVLYIVKSTRQAARVVRG